MIEPLHDKTNKMTCAHSEDSDQPYKFEVTISRNSKYEPHHDKTNKITMRPVKTQISLGIRPVWSES